MMFSRKCSCYRSLRYKSLVYKIVKRVFDRAYSAADILVSIGRDMTETNEIAPPSQPDFLIENWADDFLKKHQHEKSL